MHTVHLQQVYSSGKHLTLKMLRTLGGHPDKLALCTKSNRHTKYGTTEVCTIILHA